MKESPSIASALRLDENANRAAVSLVFTAGERPGIESVREISRRTGNFSISYDPVSAGERDTGWVELLANGLTFDVTGLAPGAMDIPPVQEHCFGIGPDSDFSTCESVTIQPGPHLSGGAGMFPVLRCLAWLGALFADLPGLRAVVWQPARIYSEPGYFRAGVLRWIDGGVFPGLGLATIVDTDDGGLLSKGLSLFIGQEIYLTPQLAMERADGAKVALRLLNWLVENGKLTEAGPMMGPSGEILYLEPIENTQIIKVGAAS